MKRQRKISESPKSCWTTEQDCILIENSSLTNKDLKVLLLYSDDEIYERKEALGLVRRQRQMMKGA